MEKDKVQEEAGIEMREEEDDESGTKRERESGEIEGGGGGEPSQKKRDPEAVSSFKQRSAASRRSNERKVAEHPDIDWSDSLAIDASSYRKDWDYVWSQAYGSFDKISQSLMEKDKVQEEAGIEMREEEDDESGTKRERESGEIEGGGGGEPSQKKRDPEAVSSFKQRSAASRRSNERKVAEHPDIDWSDSLAIDASSYRKDWDYVWSQAYGSFDKITPIPPMRYTTADPGPDYASEHDTVQIFCVKIRELRRGLQWPIHVFGLVAARDVIDHNRNITFNRTRDDCQLLTQEFPYLLLTGPTRAVVVVDPVDFEVALKVKGSIESEDKDLSFLAVQLTRISNISGTHLINKEYTSKLSTLELTFGYIVRSVEATINVRVIDGSWPEEGFSAQITARTSSLKDYRVLLLDSGDEMKKMPVTADGMIELSRRVVSVEFEGELEVSVATFGSNSDLEAKGGFSPKEDGESKAELDVGFCKLEVTVFWSLMSLNPDLSIRAEKGSIYISPFHPRRLRLLIDFADPIHPASEPGGPSFVLLLPPHPESLGVQLNPMSHVGSTAPADAASDWQKVRAEWFAKFKEYEKKVAEHPDVDWSDELAVDARHYRENWERIYARAYGPFDKSTSIPPMRYTAEPVPLDASEQYTLQIFCVKIKELRRGLQWPIHVFGLIAARDTIDHNRNMIFNRTRDDCQILTQEVPYLLLTGPTRAVVVCDPVYFEVVLKVKGSTESEDEDLSFLAVALTDIYRPKETCLITREYTSKLSTLELTFGYVVRSVEATIKVRVIDGSWPDGSSGQFTAHTSSIKHHRVV
uniref:DUF6598 domain-containing protein n=1 Tax=Oryza meridionalis TaxID=40149 RepID=A0A0E0EZ69_9ORYZ